MRSEDYNSIMLEYFDISDTETRKVLLAVNEEDKNTILVSLTSKLYQNIIDKVDNIDFGEIPESKGDITKIPNYDKIIECVDLISGILKNTKQNTTTIDTIKMCIENTKSKKDLFERAFLYDIELGIVLYSTIVLSIVSSVSYLITACVEFIKTPNSDDFEITIDKLALTKSSKNLLFKNLEKINKLYTNGEIDRVIEYGIKERTKNILGGVDTIATGIMLSTLALVIIPVLRELIYFFFYSRVKISDYFEIQADLLQINAYSVKENPTISKSDRKQIYDKQMKIVNTLRKISNFFAIQVKKAENKTESEITKEKSIKYKTSDVVDSVPDSASSVLF